MSNMIDELKSLSKEAVELLKSAKIKDTVLDIKNKYLGRKGKIASLTKKLGTLSHEEKRKAGEAINSAKELVDSAVRELLHSFSKSEKAEQLAGETLDVTLPGRLTPLGGLHPVTQVTQEVEDFFLKVGFEVAEGPEVELDHYNFESLNIPKDHPARDMQDTFYVGEGTDVLLRTHTSPVQIRVMEGRKPPLRVIAPGAVYRRDSDITHTPMFHEIEGFMVDDSVSFGELKGILTAFLHHIFGEKKSIRFRPSFFPFTEPSAEVDIECVICSGSGCRVCKSTGWLEILGCGMIHPEVFRSVGYDSENLSGFAFGLGIERIAMLKYGIDDLRIFFENDVRFLNQLR